MATTTYTNTSGHGLMARFDAFRADYADRAAKRRIYNETLNELSKLSDRHLMDLGIARANIKAIAFEAAYH